MGAELPNRRWPTIVARLQSCPPRQASSKQCVPRMSEPPCIRVVDVHKKFGALEVLKGVSFDVPRANDVSMIGASGSGKRTLLRCITCLEVPSAGAIFIDVHSLGFREDH